jgi:hypothetical protein
MNGGHETVDDAELVIEDLRHRGETVRRAGCVRDEVHGRIICLVVDAHDEHRGRVFGRGGHDDLLGPGLDGPLLFWVRKRPVESIIISRRVEGRLGIFSRREDLYAFTLME